MAACTSSNEGYLFFDSCVGCLADCVIISILTPWGRWEYVWQNTPSLKLVDRRIGKDISKPTMRTGGLGGEGVVSTRPIADKGSTVNIVHEGDVHALCGVHA